MDGAEATGERSERTLNAVAVLSHWERRLADVSKDRIVRPFEWGLDWLPPRTAVRRRLADELDAVRAYVPPCSRDSHTWFTPPPTDDYEVPARMTGHHASRFRRRGPRRITRTTPSSRGSSPASRARARRPAARGARAAAMELRRRRPRRAVPAAGAIRHQRPAAEPAVSRSPDAARAPARRLHRQLERRRTLEVCRQAVLDARRAIAWLAREGYERIGILGTSLGSCLSMLTAATSR